MPVPAAVPNGLSAAAVQRDAELDKSILNYALLNGALELLPQSWASMAIIPLQIKMVHAIGLAHGVELEIGGTSRNSSPRPGWAWRRKYVEQFGRKLLGGLLGKVAGKTIGGLGGAATGMAFSFATTYALGRVAKRYYAGGRVMSTAMLRELSRHARPRQAIADRIPAANPAKAATLDAGQIMSMVRGAWAPHPGASLPRMRKLPH